MAKLTSGLLTVFVAMGSLAAAGRCLAASNAYLWIPGIPGSVELIGREGSIAVYAEANGIAAPTNQSGGAQYPALQKALKSTRPRHAVFTVTKEVDKATPLLFQALANGQVFQSDVVIRFYRFTPQGTEEHYYTANLHN